MELRAGSTKEMGIWILNTVWSDDDNKDLITGDNGVITIGAYAASNQNEV